MMERPYTLTAPLDATAPGAPDLADLVAPLLAAAREAGFEAMVEDVIPAAHADEVGRELIARALAADGAIVLDIGALRQLVKAIAQPIDLSLRAIDGAVELMIADGDTLTVRAVTAAPVAAVAAVLVGASG